jgi:hypothetical protein
MAHLVLDHIQRLSKAITSDKSQLTIRTRQATVTVLNLQLEFTATLLFTSLRVILHSKLRKYSRLTALLLWKYRLTLKI